MVDITIVNGVYKPTYNWGAPSCTIQLNPININEHIHTYSIYRPCEKIKLKKRFVAERLPTPHLQGPY